MDKLQEKDWISSWMDDPESEKITLDMIQSRNRKEYEMIEKKEEQL